MRQSAPCHSWLSLRLCDPNTLARWSICCQEENGLPPDDEEDEEERGMGHQVSGAVPPSLHVMRFLTSVIIIIIILLLLLLLLVLINTA